MGLDVRHVRGHHRGPVGDNRLLRWNGEDCQWRRVQRGHDGSRKRRLGLQRLAGVMVLVGGAVVAVMAGSAVLVCMRVLAPVVGMPAMCGCSRACVFLLVLVAHGVQAADVEAKHRCSGGGRGQR